jgi:hypothetical protein
MRLDAMLFVTAIGCSDKGDDSSGNGMDDSGSTDDSGTSMVHDPDTADVVAVDRFSAAAGHLQVRDDMNGLPEANEPVDFDQAPFITKGFGPNGEIVEYYNFDVQPTTPAPIYVLQHADGSPVADQLNIIDVIPGEKGYNDFWQVNVVTVPDDYVANTLADAAAVMASGYAINETTMLVNCPVVPEGSTAVLRAPSDDSPTGLVRGWYDDMVVNYFTFGEHALETMAGMVPTSPIYVTFNVNPADKGGGPPSGFVTEKGSDQTHNVPSTLPDDMAYSPLWDVNIYDNADFASVMDLKTAEAATLLVPDAANVNCPIASIESM